MKTRPLFLAGCAALLATTLAPSFQAEAQISGYRYCYSAPDGEPYVYLSAVFASDTSVYHVGISNSFNAFVAGRYSGRAISGAMCMGLYGSRQEANDKLSNDAADWRRRTGREPVFTNWVYRGD